MPARLLAPSLGAVESCCVTESGGPYLQAHDVLASISYRWLHSFREFHGDSELPYPTDKSLYANTHINGFELTAIYQVTERFSLTLELPIQNGERSSYYEHDFVHRHNMEAFGVGDMRLVANGWVFDPKRNPNGNVSVSLGVKIPTGIYDAEDFVYRGGKPVRRPVDPAIQPGDGGWGIVTELSAFQKLFPNCYAYGQGVYLMNPRDSNGVQQPTGDELFFTLGEFGYTFNSVPDQYLARAGLGYVIWPKYALTATVGARVEGVPVEDFIGDSNGWRNAGYAFSVEPGISVSHDRYSFVVSAPVAFKRHADKNLTDIKVSRQFGADIGGNAAFADYLITASFTIRF